MGLWKILKKFIFGSIVVTINLVLGRAILATINQFDYYPERWLTEKMIELIPKFTSENAIWIIAGIFALILIGFELWAKKAVRPEAKKKQGIKRPIPDSGKEPSELTFEQAFNLEAARREQGNDNLMPLTKAAKSLYEDLREFDNQHKQIRMAENCSNAQMGSNDWKESILDYFAITISTHTDIFGKRPPSDKLELLPKDELDRGCIGSGGNEFSRYGNENSLYVDLVVSSYELPKILEWLKKTKFEFQEGQKSNIRIPLIELLNSAVNNGWSFIDPDSNIQDFVDGLHQAGVDGTIQFWGRKKQATDYFTKKKPLVELQKSFWKESEIYHGSCLAYKKDSFVSIGVAKDNFKTQSFKEDGGVDYMDIHVDRDQALNWLKHINPKSIMTKKEATEPDACMYEAINYLMAMLFPEKKLNEGNIGIHNAKAVNSITAKLRDGELKAWGLYVGEAVEREFNKDDWKYRELLPLEASIPTTKKPQTKVVNTDAEQHQLTGLRVNFNQVKELWPEN